MDSANIKLLLEKYWEGETSLSEENDLRNYFNGNLIDPDLIQYAPLFSYFQQEKTISMPEDKLATLNDKLIKERTLPLTWVYYRNWILKAAALVLLTAGSWWIYHDQFQSGKPAMAMQEDTYQDPKQAYDELKKALLLVSNKMHKGEDLTNDKLAKMKKVTKYIK